MNKATKWALIDGNRLLVAGLLALSSFLVMFGLTRVGLVTFTPSSTVATMFGSGIISGVFSLITITLTVNQLVLSRVFGTIDDLSDRLDGTLDFRHNVEEIAGQPESPNDPAAFLALIGETLTERAAAFEDELGGASENLREEADEGLPDVRTYADRLEAMEDSDDTLEVVSTLLGPTYAQTMTETDRLRRAHDDELTDAMDEELDAMFELLKSVAVARQFFKTIAIQQDLAQLSRMLVYIGFPVLLLTFAVTTIYTTTPNATLARPLLSGVVSLGIAVVLVPLAILLSYVLRVATIARYTVSVGPFVPPEEHA